LTLSGLTNWGSDDVLVPLVFFLFAVYSGIVFRNVLGEKWWLSLIKGSVFALMHGYILHVVYKTIVFEVTIHMI
jgi:hypothetical protein